MKMMSTKTILLSALTLITLGMVACTKSPNSPGYEYMPDMYRSPSVEAYVDYSHPDVMSARVPANGTIPYSADESKAAFNFPYPYPTGVDGYEMSANLVNPIKVTVENKDVVLAKGKKLYEQFCMHCHGEKGDGQGQIVLNGKLSGVPAYNAGAVKTLPDGKMFHSISYGKGLMGSHAGQLNKEERWILVHYVKMFQNDGTYPLDSTLLTVAPVEPDTTR